MSSAAAQTEPVFDVLGLGVVAVDDLLYVDTYPPADVKVQINHRQRRLGGLAAIALVAASRLGCKAAYAGVLGDDAFSEYAIAAMQQEAIDLTWLVRKAEACPILATIIVAEAGSTRNIFYELNSHSGAHPELPDAAVIRSTRVLLVDSFGVAGMLRAARIAHQAGIPIVADFESAESPCFPELLGLVDHLILSHEAAARLTGEPEPARAAQQLWSPGRKLAAVTCGARGAWYVTDADDGSAQHLAAFQVDTIDSTGCGDVFHGAYAACLARGDAIVESLRYASAAAALKASRAGGLTGIPTQAEVDRFLRDRLR